MGGRLFVGLVNNIEVYLVVGAPVGRPWVFFPLHSRRAIIVFVLSLHDNNDYRFSAEGNCAGNNAVAPSCLSPLYPLRSVVSAVYIQRCRCRLLLVPPTPSALKGNCCLSPTDKKKEKEKQRNPTEKKSSSFSHASLGSFVDCDHHSVWSLQSTAQRHFHSDLYFYFFLVFRGGLRPRFYPLPLLCALAWWVGCAHPSRRPRALVLRCPVGILSYILP